jgi:lipoprotein-releasing system ATP-binding protein
MGEGNRLEVLRGLDLEVQRGEAVAILGSSGAGKSTLLHILGTLDRPTLGKVWYGDREWSKDSDENLAEIRLRKIGFVFQFHHLLQEFHSLDNVAMPARMAGENLDSARARAESLLRDLGLADRLTHYPAQMSGGEQQRVAIARALMMGPEVLLADEPTGNLDTRNAARIQEILFELKERHRLTTVVVTHDLAFASRFPRQMRMRDGQWEQF